MPLTGKTYHFRKSFLAEIPLTVLFFVLLIAGIYLQMRFPSLSQTIPLIKLFDHQFKLYLPVFGLPVLLVLVILLQRVYNNRYTVCEDYIREVTGLLSLHKKDARIEFWNIRGVEIDRSIIGRMVNTGDLHIGSAMQSDPEICFWGVRNPSRVRDLILKRAKHFQLSRQNDHALPGDGHI